MWVQSLEWKWHLAKLLEWCALDVFEGTSCACLSPLIAFSVSKEISLVNLVPALRCSDRSYANYKASSLIHLCCFVRGGMRHIDKHTGFLEKASYHELDVNKIHRIIKMVHSHYYESEKVQHSISRNKPHLLNERTNRHISMGWSSWKYALFEYFLSIWNII